MHTLSRKIWKFYPGVNPSSKKPSTVHIDDNIGENGLSSQSTYRQNLKAKPYLESLIPLSRYLVSRPIDINEHISSYDLLFKAINDIPRP